jgi:two-component system response regulator (stage 0 sporulation protein F)
MMEQTKILVVDDEADTRELFQTVLSDDGHFVTLANNGEEALMLFKTGSYDLVISDILMPHTDGLQLLQEIRRTGPTVDVIITTGVGQVDSYIKAMSLGAVEYLNKPVRIHELKGIVQKVLTRRRERLGN